MSVEELRLGFEDQNDIRIFRLGGRCTLYTSQQVKDAVRAALDAGKERIIFDLSDCEYMDSAGLGSLVACRFSCSKKGGSLHLCNVPVAVLGALRLARLDRLLPIWGTLEGALAAAREGEVNP